MHTVHCLNYSSVANHTELWCDGDGDFPSNLCAAANYNEILWRIMSSCSAIISNEIRFFLNLLEFSHFSNDLMQISLWIEHVSRIMCYSLFSCI